MGTTAPMVGGHQRETSPVPAYARVPVLSAAAALAVVLLATAGRYGFHRDELYFRMLDPSWGYVDQPPLIPLIARAMTDLVADEPWALRLPAIAAVVASTLVVAAIVRELGGGALAQGLCAWTFAFATFPLVAGHVLITTSPDLLAWVLASWFVIRALLRDDGRWWLAVGLVVGLATYGRLLIPWLILGLLVGVVLVGPRRVLRSGWFWSGGALAAVVALPNLAYQVVNGFPQLDMGAALADNNADEVRVMMWPFLFIMLPAVWVVGAVALWRRPQWRALRAFDVAFVVVLVLTFVGGAQFYYPVGVLAVLFAAGWVPTASWLTRSSNAVRAGVGALLVLYAAVSVVVSLPVIGVGTLGSTPVPGINQAAADQVGWPTYVRQIAAVWDGLSAEERAEAAIITSNYGEAGAIDRYGPALGLPTPYSGQNALHDQARPPDGTETVVVVGDQYGFAVTIFEECEAVDVLRNGVGVDNEEEGVPVAVCRGPLRPWAELWDDLRHLD
ncbi:glycosyltransferase family 39 protein [Mumia sp. zg.B21]|uniref:glycosyltransferase family 39 protein n=1 Tax=Mumia sp. zg.B21 TaxID=2855447 RepID=UPI00210623DB|nr:glycosyltransferase family 39 protein [Mumia sp. zg.B21]